MREQKIIDIAELLDRQKLNRFHVLTVALCFSIFFVQGLDNTSISVAASTILRAFHAPRSAMGIAFGAANFGFLIGSLAFGHLTDRHGRRAGAILGVLLYSVPSFAAMFVHSMGEMTVLRFCTGLGLGGVFPTTIALLNETAPKKYRASFVTFAFVGYAAGNSTTGLLGALLIGPFGWRSMFLIGGGSGLLLSLALALWLPESMRFLTLRRPRSPALRRLVARVAPGVAVGDDTVFVLRQPPRSGVALAQLFQGRLKATTPLVWLNYFAEGIMYLTLMGWLPTLLEGLGLPRQQASLAFSYAAAGGIVAILLLSRVLDKIGPPATMLTALGALFAIARLGMPGLSATAIVWFTIFTISCGTGTHSSLHGTVGHFYPTRIRGNGIAYGIAASRVAAVVGPVITGFLLSGHLPMQEVLYLIAAPYLVVVAVCFLLGRLYSSSSEGEIDEPVKAEPAIEGGHGD